MVFNTEAAQAFLSSPEYRRDALPATDVYCDGVGLQAYVLLRFGRLVRRRHGPDVFADYLKTRAGARVLFLGGSEEAHQALRELFQDFFRRNSVALDLAALQDSDLERKAREVARAGHDDVLIFLGLRRQERLQHGLYSNGFTGSSIGLGAAIDFVSGTKARAGPGWQRLGLEWLPRLVRERRMWPRVLRSASLFLLGARKENLALRSYLLGHATSQTEAVDARADRP